MMQQPDAAGDAFEMRVLRRQARNRSLGAVLSEGVQRVKDSSRTAALARWTTQKAGAVAALGKQAGAAMSAGIDRAWARIERSPSASLTPLLAAWCVAAARRRERRCVCAGGTPHTGMGRPDRPPQEFFDTIDDAAKQSGGDARPLRERFGLPMPSGDSAASDSTAEPPRGDGEHPTAAGRGRGSGSLMADLAEESSDEDIFAEGDDDAMSASPWDSHRKAATKPSGVKLAARAAMDLITGRDMTGDVQGAPRGRAAAPPPREPDDELDSVARAGLDLLEGRPLVAPGTHADARLPSTLRAGIDLVQGKELSQPAPQPLGQNPDDVLHAGAALVSGRPLDPPEIAGHHEPDPTVAAGKALIRGEPFEGEPAAAPANEADESTADAAAVPEPAEALAAHPADGGEAAAAPASDEPGAHSGDARSDRQPTEAERSTSEPAGLEARASAAGHASAGTSQGDADPEGPSGAADQPGGGGQGEAEADAGNSRGRSAPASGAGSGALLTQPSVDYVELQPVASCSADFLADADFEALEAEHSSKRAAVTDDAGSLMQLEVHGDTGELEPVEEEGRSGGSVGGTAAR